MFVKQVEADPQLAGRILDYYLKNPTAGLTAEQVAESLNSPVDVTEATLRLQAQAGLLVIEKGETESGNSPKPWWIPGFIYELTSPQPKQ